MSDRRFADRNFDRVRKFFAFSRRQARSMSSKKGKDKQGLGSSMADLQIENDVILLKSKVENMDESMKSIASELNSFEPHIQGTDASKM